MTPGYQQRCPACEAPADINTLNGQIWNVDCTRCGPFKITDVAESILRDNSKSPEQIANISGYIRENSATIINQNHTDFLFKLRTPSLWEKTLRVFQRIAKEFPHPGENIRINIWGVDNILRKLGEDKAAVLDERWTKNCAATLPWLSYSWIVDGAELLYIIQRVLQEGNGFLEKGLADADFCISPAGWSFLSTVGQNSNQGSMAFVAMWFSPVMTTVWTDAIYPGVEDAGFHALRIDKHQHNNRIDDEIIVKIKECRFLVADFTGRRGGVYFEAGYALGLGKPVIWLVREQQLKKVHFDTRQYSFVTWEVGNLIKLRNELRLRIEATIGKGPKWRQT
jgi:hypothetical protein